MPVIGYSLSTEEFGPTELVRNAAQAEEAGFEFAMISDHFHPWTSEQGNAPFAWSVLGAIALATSRMTIGTAVTCPLIRYHPAIVAQAAATIACMAPGRFVLGLGSGEFLNEHVFGDAFPPPDVRQEMLAEAVDIIRLLWLGDFQHYHGQYYELQEARLYTLPDETPPIYIAASGTEAASLAGEVGDGLISTAPLASLVTAYGESGGEGPCHGQLTVCWAESEQEARETAHRVWPTAGIPGQVTWDIRSPRYFDELSQAISVDQVAEKIVCGPDPEKYAAAIREFTEAGFDHIAIHQVGPDQEGFFRFFQRELRPRYQAVAV